MAIHPLKAPLVIVVAAPWAPLNLPLVRGSVSLSELAHGARVAHKCTAVEERVRRAGVVEAGVAVGLVQVEEDGGVDDGFGREQQCGRSE
jgi:hypothetical protein